MSVAVNGHEQSDFVQREKSCYETTDEPYHSEFVVVIKFISMKEEEADIDIKVDKSVSLLVFSKKIYLFKFS